MAHAEAYGLWNAALCAVSLLLGGKLAGQSTPSRGKLLLCAFLGGAGSLVELLLPRLGGLVFFLCPLSVWICYKGKGLQAVVRALVTTLCAALLPGGAATVLMRLGQPAAPALALSALLALLAWTLVNLLPSALCHVKQVELRHRGQCVILPAMLDSGNLLNDPITSLPVVVISLRAAQALFPDYPALGSLQELPPGFRLMSVRTAAGRGVWPIFRPDGCRVYIDGRAWDARVIVAIAGRAYEGVQALVPLGAIPKAAMAMPDLAENEAAEAYSLMPQKGGR